MLTQTHLTQRGRGLTEMGVEHTQLQVLTWTPGQYMAEQEFKPNTNQIQVQVTYSFSIDAKHSIFVFN